MEFRTYRPTKLNGLILTIFERRISSPVRMRMLPDKTVSLIFNVGESHTKVKGEKIDSDRFNPMERFCFLSGFHTKPLYFQFHGHHTLGLTMNPLAVKVFFGMPAEEVKDLVLEGDFIKELNCIEDHLREMDSFQGRAQWLENYFSDKLKLVSDLHLAVKLNKTVQQMKRDVLNGKRFELEAYSGYSKMHTHRIFKDWYGLTPGKLIRYEQFSHALTLIDRSDLSLTQVGLESGFYDQAHFNRVFREFAEIAPGFYRKNKTDAPGILPW